MLLLYGGISHAVTIYPYCIFKLDKKDCIMERLKLSEKVKTHPPASNSPSCIMPLSPPSLYPGPPPLNLSAFFRFWTSTGRVFGRLPSLAESIRRHGFLSLSHSPTLPPPTSIPSSPDSLLGSHIHTFHTKSLSLSCSPPAFLACSQM